MGFIKVKFGIFNPLAPKGSVEWEGIVDTGAMYSVIPRKILEELGVKPLEKRKFRAFGGYIERDIGEVGIELMGRRRTVTVIMNSGSIREKSPFSRGLLKFLWALRELE